MYGKKNVVKQDKTPQQALESARWVCSKMERAESDIIKLLYRWGVREHEAQQQIVESLTKDRYVDNARYAGAYVREKSNISHWGAAKIAAALRAKGIAHDVIQTALEENTDRTNTTTQLEKDLRRRAENQSNTGKTSYETRARLFRWAAGRGHNFDDINDILNRILTDDEY